MTPDIKALLNTTESLQRHGLLVERTARGVSANVAHVPYHSPDGFAVGYAGSGPSELALSVMHALLPPLLTPEAQQAAWGDDSTPPRADLDQLLANDQNWSEPLGRSKVHVSNLAFALHHRFKEAFLINVPDEDAFRIPIETIRQWIAEARKELRTSCAPHDDETAAAREFRTIMQIASTAIGDATGEAGK
jgi:hypothetical protein